MNTIVILTLIAILGMLLYLLGKHVRETQLVRWKLIDSEGFDDWLDRQVHEEWMETDFEPLLPPRPAGAGHLVLVTRWSHWSWDHDLIFPGDRMETQRQAWGLNRGVPDGLQARMEWMTAKEFDALEAWEEVGA